MKRRVIKDFILQLDESSKIFITRAGEYSDVVVFTLYNGDFLAGLEWHDEDNDDVIRNYNEMIGLENGWYYYRGLYYKHPAD